MKRATRFILVTGALLNFGCSEDKSTNSGTWSPPDHRSVRISNLTGKLAGSLCMGCPLIVFDVANNDHRQLTENVGSNPNWSSDGERIVFEQHNGNAFGPAVYAADADGSDITLLVEDGGQPALSPDGEHLAFIKYDANNQSANLSILNLGNREAITFAQDAQWPSWHPDGTRLAYSQTPGSAWMDSNDEPPDVSQFQSYVVDLTKSGSQPLVRGLTPVWSPDGQRLAFARADPARIAEQGTENEMGVGMASGIDLYIANADGTGEELIYQSQQPLAALLFGLETIHGWSQDSQELLIGVWTTRLSDGCGEDTGAQPPEDFVSTPDCYRISGPEVHLMDIRSRKSKIVSADIVNPAWHSK